MYEVATDKNVSGAAPAMPAIGSDFWNLEGGTSPSNINPNFPLTYAVIKSAQ